MAVLTATPIDSSVGYGALRGGRSSPVTYC